jgi:hypothetical protein
MSLKCKNWSAGINENFSNSPIVVPELLGSDDMLPAYVERKRQCNPGSLSWSLPVKMDEAERVKKKGTSRLVYVACNDSMTMSVPRPE